MLALHDAHQRRNGVDAKAIERIANAVPKRFELRPEVGNFAAIDTRTRCIGRKYGHAQHHGARLFLRCLHECGDQRGGVLPVRVHGEDVRIAQLLGLLQAVQHRGAFAVVAWQGKDAQTIIVLRHVLQQRRAFVGAAIHDDPDRIPVLASCTHGFNHDGSGVVARDQNQMRGRGNSRGNQGVVSHAKEYLR